VTVTTRYFAVFRERMGGSHAQVSVEPGTTVAGLWEKVTIERPDVALMRSVTRFAVNGSYAEPDTELHDGDEVAFLPPMSGG
jgi:molybdopterin synthase sulfur carrier subunit